MTIIEITVPSKTFLLGEYAVLKGLGGMVLSTEPRFKLIATYHSKNTLEVEGIDTHSPTGKFLNKEADLYQSYRIEFIDPYHGLGGFGASSAQFVMAYALKQYLSSEKVNDLDLLSVYKQFAWDNQGIPPSGVDLIAQVHGDICYYSREKNELKIFSWPFSDIGFCLIHTGTKLATHTHLKNDINFNSSELEEDIQLGLESLENKNSHQFIHAINQFAMTLQIQNLVADNTRKILKQLSGYSEILACKGCGALGADVILIIYKLNRQNDLLTLMKKLNLNVITYGTHLAKGLQIQKRK